MEEEKKQYLERTKYKQKGRLNQIHSREKETDSVKEQWNKNARLRERIKYSKEHRLEIYRICERKSYNEKADFVKEHTIILKNKRLSS